MALTYDERETDMASLPSLIRGTIAGIGSFSGEATLQYAGPFTKAETEELLERIPDFTPGACRVTLTLLQNERA